MAKNHPDERLIYLALKNTFKGQDARACTDKKVRKRIQKQLNKGGIEVRALVAEHNIDNVCNTAKALLQDGIFESTLKAKKRFPEVFTVSPVQSADRTASEAEAARSDVHAIREAVEKHQGTRVAPEADEPDLVHKDKGKGKEPASQVSTTRPRKPSFRRASVSVPSLYPVYLPFKTQHWLLVKVQAMLEDACYAFGRQMMGDVLQKEGWNCPECVELHAWARVFRKNEDKFNAEELLELGKPFPEILESIAQIRHTAVHRIPVSANTVQEFMTTAKSLANMLHNNTCAQTLSRMRREAQQVIEELGRHKDLLESILKEKLQEIDVRRRELDCLECKAVEDMLREDEEYQILASANLGQAIGAPETIPHSESTSEHDTSSETEVEIVSFGRSSFGQAGKSASSSSKPADIGY